MFLGRDAECALLDELLEEGRRSRSGVIVVRGDPGIGKTALLQQAASRAEGYCVLQAAGVQSEVEFAFATAHQLLLPVLDHVPGLPGPQRKALEGAFGLAGGVVENRFMISLGVLGLLAEVAEERPVLCVIDDAHWLDVASADTFTFAARRLQAERVVVLFGARGGEARAFTATGLPELTLTGLPQDAARNLVEQAAPGVAPHVRDALMQGAAGNPLGLRELPRSLTAEQLAGTSPLPDPLPANSAVESIFLARVREQPREAQTVMLVAAASRFARAGVVARAAVELGLEPVDLDGAEQTGLLRVQDGQLRFSHPLIRSAVYRGATFAQRQEVHRALAKVSQDSDPEGAAWHLAAAATGPDDVAANGLEIAAGNAQRRGGYSAASVALQHAAVLSEKGEDKTRRLAAAGVAAWRAGHMDRARTLLDYADSTPVDLKTAAEVAQVQGTLEFFCGSPRYAYTILVGAAERVTELDPSVAARLLGEAAQVAWTSGDVERLAKAAEMLRGLSGLVGAEAVLSLGVQAVEAYLSGNYVVAADFFRRAVASGRDLKDLRAATIAAGARVTLGDDGAAIDLFEQTITVARGAGALEMLPGVLALLASSEIYVGRYSGAAMSADEGLRLATDTCQEIMQGRLRSTLAWLAAVQGRVDECRDLAAQVITERPGNRPWPPAVAFATWALAMAELGTGRYAEAYSLLEGILNSHSDLGHKLVAISSAADLVETAVRTGNTDGAHAGLDTLEAWAQSTGAPWGMALVSRCKALMDPGDGAEYHYEEALRQHTRAIRALEAARTELLFGEWLRRRRRRTEARSHLRRALAEFDRMGATPWVDRAQAELRATGETARKREPSAVDELTPQELQIALAVGRGATNREVAARVFLSPRTVDYHLHKVFTKLGISSRTELVRLTLEHAEPEPAARAGR